jgi:hypothetical protein
MMMWLMIVTIVEVFSINALWKNKIAVLVGDLLSKGLLLSIDHSDFDLLVYFCRCARNE